MEEFKQFHTGKHTDTVALEYYTFCTILQSGIMEAGFHHCRGKKGNSHFKSHNNDFSFTLKFISSNELQVYISQYDISIRVIFIYYHNLSFIANFLF